MKIHYFLIKYSKLFFLFTLIKKTELLLISCNITFEYKKNLWDLNKKRRILIEIVLSYYDKFH